MKAGLSTLIAMSLLSCKENDISNISTIVDEEKSLVSSEQEIDELKLFGIAKDPKYSLAVRKSALREIRSLPSISPDHLLLLSKWALLGRTSEENGTDWFINYKNDALTSDPRLELLGDYSFEALLQQSSSLSNPWIEIITLNADKKELLKLWVEVFCTSSLEAAASLKAFIKEENEVNRVFVTRVWACIETSEAAELLAELYSTVMERTKPWLENEPRPDQLEILSTVLERLEPNPIFSFAYLDALTINPKAAQNQLMELDAQMIGKAFYEHLIYLIEFQKMWQVHGDSFDNDLFESISFFQSLEGISTEQGVFLDYYFKERIHLPTIFSEAALSVLECSSGQKNNQLIQNEILISLGRVDPFVDHEWHLRQSALKLFNRCPSIPIDFSLLSHIISEDFTSNTLLAMDAIYTRYYKTSELEKFLRKLSQNNNRAEITRTRALEMLL